MKKIILIIGAFLLVGVIFTTAAIFGTKQEAIDYFNTYKDTREDNIDNAVTDIEYTTDKTCEINYDSESISCQVCIEYTYSSVTHNTCVPLSEGTTLAEDKATVRQYVRDDIRDVDEPEKVTYTERAMQGDKIDLIEAQI